MNQSLVPLLALDALFVTARRSRPRLQMKDNSFRSSGMETAGAENGVHSANGNRKTFVRGIAVHCS